MGVRICVLWAGAGVAEAHAIASESLKPLIRPGAWFSRWTSLPPARPVEIHLGVMMRQEL